MIGSNKPSVKSERLINKTLPDIVPLKETNDRKSSIPMEMTKKSPQKVKKIRQDRKLERTKRNVSEMKEYSKCMRK